MPFTISHVAAVLPARQWLRRRGLFSAAVIGTMVPDLGFLLPWHMMRASTHGVRALLTFCLPVGCGAWLLYQLLIRPAWSAVLPGGWRLRDSPGWGVLRSGDWSLWLGVAGAVLAGALTHLVWDGFTHEDGRGVRMLPFLDDYYGPELVGHSLRLYRWLQHGSSVFGLAVVLAAAWRWTHDGRTAAATRAGAGTDAVPPPPELSARERCAWLCAYVAIPATVLLMAALLGYPQRHSWGNPGAMISGLAFLGLGGLGVSLFLVSTLILVRLSFARRGRPPLDG